MLALDLDTVQSVMTKANHLFCQDLWNPLEQKIFFTKKMSALLSRYSPVRESSEITLWFQLEDMFQLIGTPQGIEKVTLQLKDTPVKVYAIGAKSLFVFSTDGPKQNATSLLTPVSNIVFYALSSGTLGFALHGSFNNHLHERIWLAVEEFPPIRKWFTELPWRAKPRVPLERA